MKKQEVISQVQNSLGSLFTKDDVVNCLNMVVEEPKVEQVNPMQVAYPNRYWLDKIRNGILERIRNTDFNDSDNIEITDCEFSINRGNEVELDSFEVDGSSLRNYIENEIEDFFGMIEDDIIELQNEKEEDERLSSNEALKEAIED